MTGVVGSRPRRRNPEADLQRDVVRLLRMSLPPGAILHHSPNEQRAAGPEAQAILVGMGVHPGWADLVVLYAGRVVFLELKAKAAVSPAQAEFRDAVRAQGHTWALARSCKDAVEALVVAGVPVRVRGL